MTLITIRYETSKRFREIFLNVMISNTDITLIKTRVHNQLEGFMNGISYLIADELRDIQ